MEQTQDDSGVAPIAIIGMGFRLPAGIASEAEFWQHLIEKRDARCRVPENRYNVNGFRSTKLQQGQTVASEYGYFLESPLSELDVNVFGSTLGNLDVMDPQLRLLLEVVWECMESAGRTDLVGSKTGVFVGAFGEDWHNMLHKDSLMQNTYRVLSAGDYALSNVLSYQFDMTGPSMTLRTACSSSLCSLHVACQSLRNGDCSAAIVAGSSLIMDPTMTLDMSSQGVLAADGCCKVFDASADGFARGEAINALLLKPLDDAIRDGDPIRAVIRATAVNSDGKTPHLGVPSHEAQVSLIRHAYKNAGIDDPSLTPFVECHGTGTIRGDPIETAAVGEAFGGDRKTYIGSVKSNLGHGEGAAAITSIIKCVLALENKTIPPNLHFETPNPKIPFDKLNLQVPIEATTWPHDRPERVSINSFGFGGSNAHVILESASYGRSNVIIKDTQRYDSLRNGSTASYTSSMSIIDNPNQRGFPRLVPVSSKSEAATKSRLEAIQKYLDVHPESLDNVVYTLSQRTAHLSHRGYAIYCDGIATPVCTSLASKPALKGKKGIIYVFTGQGAQYVGMAENLMHSSATFCQQIHAMDQILQHIPKPPSWTLAGLLKAGEASSVSVDDPELSQTLCTAIQIALCKFLESCGLIPAAVIGHSSGEIAAACVSGFITVSEAIQFAYFRGLATKTLSKSGSMAAIGLGRDAVLPHLQVGEGCVQIACENSPDSVTISGDMVAVDQALAFIKQQHADVFTRKLKVSVAYHSEHIKEISSAYEKMMQPGFVSKQPNTTEESCRFYSSVTGDLVTHKTSLDPAYWRRNMESTVLFSTALHRLILDYPDAAALVEIGPHSALQAPIRQILQGGSKKDSPPYVASLVRGKPADVAILATLGELYKNNIDVDFSFVNPQGSVVSDLARYAWDRTPNIWKESRISKAWRFRKFPHHELLGARCESPSDLDFTWRNIFFQHNILWLKDHKLGSDIVFPVAGYIAIMGEALRQILCAKGYIIERLIVKAALMIPETDELEIITTMQAARLSHASNSSTWNEFSIKALIGDRWVETCVARAKAVTFDEDTEEVETKGFKGSTVLPLPLPRHVLPEYFYTRMQHIGFCYGPRFRGLHNITTAVGVRQAVGSIPNNKEEEEAEYALHPTTIDHAIQLAVVAGCMGLARNIETLGVPVDLGSIEIHPSSDMELIGTADVDEKSGMADVRVFSKQSGRCVLELKRGRTIPFNNSENAEYRNSVHAARLHWLPDITCNDQNSADMLTRSPNLTLRAPVDVLEKFARACALRMALTVEHLGLDNLMAPLTKVLASYSSWLKDERNAIGQNEELKLWLDLDQDGHAKLLDALLAELVELGNSNAVGIARMMRRIATRENLEAIFTDEKKALEILVEDGGLRDYYNLVSREVSADSFLRLLAHKTPTLRILEIGAGTGSVSETILESLVTKDGCRTYGQYVFSDISGGFFPSAQERLTKWENVEYKVLDIEKKPTEQGFELESFDLIIASNVFHATSSLQNTLSNVRSLLKPKGHLYFQELTVPLHYRIVKLVTGLLPGWWAATDDCREDGPCVSVNRWSEELVKAGFSGVDSVVLDGNAPYCFNAHMITTVVEQATNSLRPIKFLYKANKTELGLKLADIIQAEEAREVQWIQLGADSANEADKDPEEDALGTNTETTLDIHDVDLVSMIELEGSFFDKVSETDYNALICLLKKQRGGLFWLTGSAQVCCTDPGYGTGIGYLRTVRSELGLECWTIELQDTGAQSAIPAVLKVLQKFRARVPLARGIDSEYSITSTGITQIPRLHWLSTSTELEALSGSQGPKQLVVGQYGVTESLQWVTRTNVPHIAADEVEIHVRHVGLNFKDVLNTMGVIHDAKDALGLECTGIVLRKGSNVDNLEVGDAIFCLWSGLFSTRKVLPAKYAVRLLPGMTLDTVATMPVAYATAVQALVNLGNLQKGQSVLIHSGAGGVGQAAIQIGKILGAEIFTTVSSEQKIQFLQEQYGIPRERIFHSRNDSFLADIMRSTNGRGVDLVLNSLAGDLLHASWQCVAKSGKMMEIGKRDMMEYGRIALDMFQGNRAFFGIDLSTMPKDDVLGIIKQFAEIARMGDLSPITPIHRFAPGDILNAFQFMKKGQHIGKILITMPEDESVIAASISDKTKLFRHTSTYLIIGGLGGLGKEVARWMIERGASSLCFLSPSAQNDKHLVFINELESEGHQITTVAGDVAKMGDVEAAIRASPTPIAGVLQLSMILRDKAILDIGYSDWYDVHAPKIQGTWNLHHALASSPLDFFILMGSVAGTVGQPGQANYAAANSFLDSFSQYRHSLGMPCSVIDLGGMEGVGLLASKPSRMNQFKSSGLFLLQEEHLLEAIQIALFRSSVNTNRAEHEQSTAVNDQSVGFTPLHQIAVGLRSLRSISDPRNVVLFKSDLRFAMYENLKDNASVVETNDNDSALRDMLAQVEADPKILERPDTLEQLSWEMGRALFKYLSLPEEDLKIDATLESIGVDSLTSIEIRNWWRRSLGLDITVLEIMNCGTIQGLALCAIGMLKKKYNTTE